MAKQSSNAGAGAVRPSPSRRGSLIEESRPLQTYLTSLDAMRPALVPSGAPAFAFSPLNVMPKIALGKLDVEQASGGLVLSDGGGVRVAPTASPSEYYQTLLELLEDGRPLHLVPEPIAAHFKLGGYTVSKQHDEYVMRTEDVQTFPGKRNRQMRGNVNKARRLCEVEVFDGGDPAEYKALVKTWYRQNADLKFRTYDKTSIDWLLENWSELVSHVPDLLCLGLRHDAQLISLNMGCRLTDQHWTAYTQRFDRHAPVKHANMLGYQTLAHSFADCALENDGTADTKTIREWKDRLVSHKISFYTVRK